ncbi:unnamed protein product [Prorocentrum cordatum]|uniref:Uncharacterized protein n=1 Tax=Prorocentrum cordatum TaxID=2364126 RepID=A0ABN9VMK0_9DINO|nr:unnamed protein product [Polarella glacialis]
MRSVLRFLWPQGVHRDHADIASYSPSAEAHPEGSAGKAWPSENDDGGSTRCPSLEVPERDGDARDACLAKAMQGSCDADAAIEAWGAELGIASGDVTIQTGERTLHRHRQHLRSLLRLLEEPPGRREALDGGRQEEGKRLRPGAGRDVVSAAPEFGPLVRVLP